MKGLHNLRLPKQLYDALQAARDRITAEFNVDRMVLFGSVARGQSDEESDADLLIVLTEPPNHAIRDRITARNRGARDSAVSKGRAKAEAVHYWWDKALESLKAARRELAAGAYTFAINRAYYALFYAVSALLLEERRRFSKHSGVRAALNRDIIQPGRLSRKHGDLYNQLFRDRQEGAEPLAGMQHLHGKKGRAVVHVGAVDAPVTIDEINACIEECLAVRQSELHVLGWEWEMGLANLMVEEAKHHGVKLLLLNIPREVMEQQAVEKGDIRFFEVAHLEVEIKQEKGRKVTVTLKDFAFPYADLIPEDVRSKIKKWSDYIDCWAVDWNFQNDTFMNGWVAYRTRKERKLPLASDPHVYEKPGKYTIMVKVVDIFGNDTSQAFEVEVK